MSGVSSDSRESPPAPTVDGRPGAFLTVDLDALQENYRRLRREASGALCVPVVKADGYGIGIKPAALALAAAGARDFFVATLDEAERLDTALAGGGLARDDRTITVLNGPLPGTEDAFGAIGATPVLNSLGQIEAYGALARRVDKPLAAHVHIDTGMSRLGLPPGDAERLAGTPELMEGIDIDLVMSHLACAEETDNPMNVAQRKAFDKLCQGLPGRRFSLANSSGIFLGPDFHYDAVRPGCALYGVNPTPGRENPMRRVVALQAPIIQCRRIDRPQTVGYGATFKATGPTHVATIAFGYADGYPRSLSDKGSCFVAGHRVPVIGRVSMDLITLDVSDLPEKLRRPGTEVEILGDNIDVNAFADIAETIGYEVLTNLATGRRIARRYLGGGIGHEAG